MLQGQEAVKRAVLDTWAQFMDCPEVATKAINFIAVDWPSQQVGGRPAGAGPGFLSVQAPPAWQGAPSAGLCVGPPF